jgi:hypothetical protein
MMQAVPFMCHVGEHRITERSIAVKCRLKLVKSGFAGATSAH